MQTGREIRPYSTPESNQGQTHLVRPTRQVDLQVDTQVDCVVDLGGQVDCPVDTSVDLVTGREFSRPAQFELEFQILNVI